MGMVLGQEPRQTTSVLGHLVKPSIQALIHGLNRHYYSIAINYRKNELEQRMLMNLNKKSWVDGLTLRDYNNHCNLNQQTVGEMLQLAKNYDKDLEEKVDVLMTNNVVQLLGAMLDAIVFK